MKKRPNIIVFMTDQQNGDTVLDRSQAITPNLDAFKQSAVQFTQAYCASPHCCPSRASFFSGLYPSQHGVWNNVEVDNAISRGLYDGVKLFPESLKEQGYHTVFSGKWHVSAYEGPKDRGFDEVLYEYISNYGRFQPCNRPRNKDWEKVYHSPEKMAFSGTKRGFGELVREGYPVYRQFDVSETDQFGDKITVERACEVLYARKPGDEPLFLFAGPTGPHDPYYPPQEYLDLYRGKEINLPENFDDTMEDKPALYRRTKERFSLSREEHVECIRHYLAMVSYEDFLFGKVLEAVKKSGEWENTFIFYLTDHGDYMGAHGLWSKGLPCFREAYHICALAGGGKIDAPKQVDELVSITDFAPTILELAGVHADSALSGRSLVDFLRGRMPVNWRRELFVQTNGNELYGIQRAVWNRKWKYVFNGFDYDELYDLEEDPGELHNRIDCAENREVVKAMCRKIWEFARKTGDNCTCEYIMVSLAPYGPGILLENTDGSGKETLADQRVKAVRAAGTCSEKRRE